MKYEVRIWSNPNGKINICRIKWVDDNNSDYMYSRREDCTMDKLMFEIKSILNTNNFNRDFRWHWDWNRNNARYKTLMFIGITT